jgi:hypothetical protein
LYRLIFAYRRALLLGPGRLIWNEKGEIYVSLYNPYLTYVLSLSSKDDRIGKKEEARAEVVVVVVVEGEADTTFSLQMQLLAKNRS